MTYITIYIYRSTLCYISSLSDQPRLFFNQIDPDQFFRYKFISINLFNPIRYNVVLTCCPACYHFLYCIVMCILSEFFSNWPLVLLSLSAENQ